MFLTPALVHVGLMVTDAQHVFAVTGITFGKKVRLARVALGLRQSEVARGAFVTPYQVSSLERGFYVTPAAVRRVIQYFGIEGEP